MPFTQRRQETTVDVEIPEEEVEESGGVGEGDREETEGGGSHGTIVPNPKGRQDGGTPTPPLQIYHQGASEGQPGAVGGAGVFGAAGVPEILRAAPGGEVPPRQGSGTGGQDACSVTGREVSGGKDEGGVEGEIWPCDVREKNACQRDI